MLKAVGGAWSKWPFDQARIDRRKDHGQHVVHWRESQRQAPGLVSEKAKVSEVPVSIRDEIAEGIQPNHPFGILAAQAQIRLIENALTGAAPIGWYATEEVGVNGEQ